MGMMCVCVWGGSTADLIFYVEFTEATKTCLYQLPLVASIVR